MVSYQKVFGTIKISVSPIYVPIESSCFEQIWAYNIKIHNLSNEKYRLIAGYWQIPDEHGEMKKLDSNMKQLTIGPGEILEFVKGIPYTEYSDIVIGSYSIVNENDELFEIHVPVFAPESPSALNTIH